MPPSLQKPFYQLQVYTKTFRHKSLPLQQKIRSEYIPLYWKKLKMDQKIIKPSGQDRLSNLTTKQIDRIIDMEKIKYVLNGKKKGKEELYLEKFGEGQNKHPNVYRANFLSKINKIAIQRGIQSQQAQGFESIYGQYNPQSIRRKELQRQKQSIKYIKQYKSTKKQQKNINSLQIMRNKMEFNVEDQKSVKCIEKEMNLEQFDQKLEDGVGFKTYLKRNKSLREDKKLLCSRKWFDGMSTFYLQENKFFGAFSSDKQTKQHMDISSIFEGKSNRKRRTQMFNCSRVKTQPIQMSFNCNFNKENYLTSSTFGQNQD